MIGCKQLGVALLLTLVWHTGLEAQTAVLGRNVTLVNIGTGTLAEANADGTHADTGYTVGENRQLCVKDVAWHVVGDPAVDAELGLSNTNVDGTSLWVMWWIHPKLNGEGKAGGAATFTAGPQVTANGGISYFSEDITGLRLTIYGIERDLPTMGAETPCLP